eukprot:TRINITY_DN22595_c0_g1_i1.p1 TRINITY_DN22595_c0_g1~~TRINITY_DN22595_c0_g1_i1.p1  ORF type:complete len:187 (+),score=63.61 TRINITY_DN22595_c0_g1_i1:93-653(+)
MADEQLPADHVAFAAQFDRSGPEFHAGDPTPVPIGGARVPQSMSGPEVVVQAEAPAAENFGPEYDRVFALRTNLGNLKKAIDALNPPLEAILRLRLAGKESDPAFAKEVKKRDDAIAALRECDKWFVEPGEFDKRPVIDEIANGATVTRTTAEEQADYMLANKRHTQKIFNEQKALLAKLKDLKKQ